MILRNHGLLTVGETVARAWTTMWQLERACQIQILAQSTGQPIRQAPLTAIEKTAGLFDGNDGSMEWGWLLRTIDKKDESYKQ
jgi:ribulose-5-phosphate 4-epimerase/fuculose-1-phosphate aldolase